MYAISKPRKSKHHKIDVIARLPLKPSEYCKRWVSGDPEERGYRTRCMQVISRVTSASMRSMERWGDTLDDCPETVERALRKQDILNQIKQLIDSDLDSEINE